MKRPVWLFALLALISLVVVVNWLLRGPPAPEPGGNRVRQDPGVVMAPPAPTVTKAKSPTGAVDAPLELRLADAVTTQPIEGALASLKEIKAGAGERSFDFTEEGGGLYRLDERPADGPHILHASAPGYECLRWRLTMTSEDRGLNAEIMPLTDVVVMVEDTFGTPIPDAGVTLTTADWGVFRCVHPAGGDETVLLEASYEGVSDGSGAVVFGSFVPGEGYAVSVVADTMEPVRLTDIRVEPTNPHIVNIVIDEGARIIGTIRDAEGAPGTGFTVTCRRRSEDSTDGVVIMEVEGTVISRDDGYFELDGLSPGFKELNLSRRTRNRLETCVLQVTVRRGRTHDCGVVGPTPLSEGGGHLRVHVSDEDGGRLTGARVIVMKDNPDPIDDEVTTGDSGWCHVLGVNPGLVTIGAHVDGFLTETVRVKLEAGEDKEVLVTLKRPDPSRFRRLIVQLERGDSRNFNILDLVHRELKPYVESDEGEWLPHNWSSQSDQGKVYFELRDVPPGQYWAMVIGDGLITRPEPVFVEAPESEVELTLEEAIEVRGRVVDASTGAGVAATVTRLLEARANPRNRFFARKVESDPEGKFVLRAFGSWEERGLLEVRAEGYQDKIVEIHPGVGDVGEIGLSRGR